MDAAPRIRVLVCHEQPLVRSGLRAVLEREPGIEVIGEAATSREAVAVALCARPTVVILDIAQPCREVVEVIRLLSAASVEQPTRVVALASPDKHEIIQAAEAGARGFLLKNCPAEELVRATRVVAAGEGFITPRLAGRLLDLLARQWRRTVGSTMTPALLTDSQRAILEGLMMGLTDDAIARRLDVCTRTVRRRIAQLMRQLKARSRVELGMRIAEQGLVPGSTIGIRGK